MDKLCEGVVETEVQEFAVRCRGCGVGGPANGWAVEVTSKHDGNVAGSEGREVVKEGVECGKADGWRLVGADYSEWRTVRTAYITSTELIVSTFTQRDGSDLHRLTSHNANAPTLTMVAIATEHIERKTADETFVGHRRRQPRFGEAEDVSIIIRESESKMGNLIAK